MTTQIIIHGHFYQPPRENPWTESIERQDSAAPYHDWNERITAECYRPNGRSRVLDGRGRIKDIVNNYEHLSFNFGPTLLNYLEAKAPATYRRILDADRESQTGRGFGNAMAQAYNHMILPLASDRDRQSQVRWGLTDFRTRFGRMPEGMWLPETAVNQASLDKLAENGLKFVLLAPGQIEAFRPLGGKWRSVGDGSVPTHRVYTHHTASGPISVFVYDGGLSKAVAFEHLLRNAGLFADRLQAAADGARPDPGEDRLVFVCTDGESYGHHEPMGDMCLAYLASRELPRRDLKLTNPAAFLAAHKPKHEILIKSGEGTAWSCAHGVGRWARDCGCSTGGPPSWNQGWREPLRGAFDALRKEIDPLYERLGKKLFADPWAARDDYVQILLGKPLGAAKRFFDQHALGELSDEERSQAYRLLEMQRNGMLMYTSCAWFFADLSGIETVQVLRYYARAVQLAALLSDKPVDTVSEKRLTEAKSNLRMMGTGTELLQRFVAPSMLSARKAAAHQALITLMEPGSPVKRLYAFRVRMHDSRRVERAGLSACACRVSVEAERTREGGTFNVVVLAGSKLRVRIFVRDYAEGLPQLDVGDLLDVAEKDGFAAACAEGDAIADESLGLADMLHELKLSASRSLLEPVVDEMRDTFDALFRKHEGLLHTMQPFGIKLPRSLVAPIAYGASRRFNQLIERNLDDGCFEAAEDLHQVMSGLGLPRDARKASRLASERLAELLDEVLEKPDAKSIGRFEKLLESTRELELDFDEAGLQDRVMDELDKVLDGLLHPTSPAKPQADLAKSLVEMAGYLNLLWGSDPDT